MATKEEQEAAKHADLVAKLADLGISETSGTESIAPYAADADNETLAALLKQAVAEKKAADKASTPEQAPKKAPEPGTVIKTYVQNGHRYQRVVQPDGSTVDVRG